MEPGKITNADFLDILFEGKNKAYGAYELRKTYNKRMGIAITGMAVICLLFFISRLLANGHNKENKPLILTDIILESTKPKEKTPEPVQVKPPKTIPPRVETRIYTPPQIVQDDQVTDPPPVVETLERVQIGLVNEHGAEDEGFVAPPVEQSTGVVTAPKTTEQDYDIVFRKVEVEAKFPGGPEAWKKYLERHLNANVAGEDGAAEGNYTVTVQFIVDKEGGISSVQAIDVPKACPDCAAEAIKVIKNGPRWEPAIQNDRKVNYQAVQLITFQVAEP